MMAMDLGDVMGLDPYIRVVLCQSKVLTKGSSEPYDSHGIG